MMIELIDCPACGKRISSQASSCPNCGQPIRPTLKLVEKKNNIIPQLPSEANIEEGVGTVIVLAIIFAVWVWSLSVVFDPYETEKGAATIWTLITGLGYLGLWGTYTYQALTRNEIGKIILLTFLPGIGIILCAFLSPKEKKDQNK